ncbi:alginate O-acetyltransferase AlgF [Pseudomonas sp. BMS12]|uniref:alginate O-acetyltransferase AlgF n=1 Tax=Pseudomonas sp. BMS12 TaxID=1796033 RepID=UPI00083A94D1|nr:alginate O-acetyltransferase AlgF [Pseudomonas sp. BMS12]
MNNLSQRLLLALCLTVPVLAHAQDGNAALYDAVAPAGSAFVRMLNLTGSGSELMVSGKSAAQKIGAGQLGNYQFVAPGAHKLSAGSTSLQTELKANSATTLVFDGQQLKPIADTYSEDSKKALIAFYNLTDKPLSLKTLDGKHAVVESVPSGQSGSRPVNEIKIGFAAYAGEQNLAKFDELFLKKGRSYSYLVIPDGAGVRTIASMNGLDSIK